MSLNFRLHILANTEDNSDTGDLELIRHLHVNVSSLKILLQGTAAVTLILLTSIHVLLTMHVSVKLLLVFNNYYV